MLPEKDEIEGEVLDESTQGKLRAILQITALLGLPKDTAPAEIQRMVQSRVDLWGSSKEQVAKRLNLEASAE